MLDKYIHDDKVLFKDVIELTASALGIHPKIIEKDYYVTLLLERIVKKKPDILFKGGTSLSKCFGVINRFSEDIDLNVIGNKPTQTIKRQLKYLIFEAVDELGLTISNKEHIYSRSDFNQYLIEYPTFYDDVPFLNKFLKIEVAVFLKAYPYEIKRADNLILRYLRDNEHLDIIQKYGLHEYEIPTQSLARTFIDKCFAICDYYLEGKIKEHSRHLYDIHKILPHIVLNGDLKALYKEVREDRSKDKNCPSAQIEGGISYLLNEICQKRAYENDYTEITMQMLFSKENVSYSETIESIARIISSGLFEL